MSAQPIVHITEDDYLKMERMSPFKNEYYRGNVYAMGGASFRHNKILSNLVGEVIPNLKNKKCSAYFNDLRIHVPDPPFYAYPDLIILCGKEEFSDEVKDTITNPTVIIEILSKSTEQYDKSVKFGFYRFARSFKEYFLIHQDKPLVECFLKMDDFNWLEGSVLGVDKKMNIQSIGLEISLSEIYNEVNFDTQFDIK